MVQPPRRERREKSFNCDRDQAEFHSVADISVGKLSVWGKILAKHKVLSNQAASQKINSVCILDQFEIIINK